MRPEILVMTETWFLEALKNDPERIYKELAQPERPQEQLHPDSQEAMELGMLETDAEYDAGRVWGRMSEELRERFFEIADRAMQKVYPHLTAEFRKDILEDVEAILFDTMPRDF